MKKILIFLAVILCFTLAFVACDNSEDPTETPTTAPTEAPTTAPTEAPTQAPTEAPTEEPTEAPVVGVEYKVVVKDENGTPVKGVSVQICKDDLCMTPVKTDANGVATFELEEYEGYKAKVLKAEGYEFSTEYTYFANGATELTLKVTTVAEECDHVEVTIPAVAATCTEAGLSAGVKCSVCDLILTAPAAVNALGHTEEIIPAVAATCTETGLTAGKKCSVCDFVITAQAKTDALGHSEEDVPAVNPTCTETGLTAGVKCSVCDVTLEKQKKVDALGHIDENNDLDCDRCDVIHGSADWMFDIKFGLDTTPAFTDEINAWYYTYVTPAYGTFTVDTEGAAFELMVDGDAIDGNSSVAQKKDDIVLCIKKGSDNSAISFKTSFHNEIKMQEMSKPNAYLANANQGTVSLESDANDTYIKFTTTMQSDPYFSFNIKTYQTQILKIASKNTLNSEYKYILFKVKAENCSPSSLMMYFWTNTTVGAPWVMGSEFIPGSDGWHYVYFDLSANESWNGTLDNIRIDLHEASTAQNTILISSFIGFTTYSDALCYAGVELTGAEKPVLTPEQEAEKNELLSGTAPNGSYETYEPETATNEDADINLWFDHTYTRTPQTQVTPGDMFSYKLLLAKNEAEACQLILSTEVAKTGLTIEMSDFVHTNGIDKMESELLQGYYFEVEGEWIIDPLPPTGLGTFATFDIKANNSQTFIVKAISKADSAAGEYSATVVVKDAAGNEIKKVTVFAYVWNFTLSDASSCKTLMDLGNYYSIFGVYSAFDPNFSYVDPETGEMSDTYNFIVNSDTYGNYYKFLLEYRVCSYSIPGIEANGKYGSSTMSYLNNPRVVAFINLGWDNNKNSNFNAQNLQNAYNSLTNSDGTPKLDAAGNSLLDKAYFYPVDEPGDQNKLNAIINAANLIKENYSTDYNLIAPMHIDGHITTSDGKVVDFFEYVKGAVTSWCPKTFFYTTMAEYANNTSAEKGTSIYAENTLGLFKDRMEAEQEAGNEAWWYVTRKPYDPEITLGINQDAMNYRILFWQQKLYNVDGFLYYLSNDWAPASDNAPVDNKGALLEEYNKTGGWYSKHEVSVSNGYDVYGNGVLIYPGFKIALDYLEPVGSLRLECIRDGIEDYEYFTMLEEHIGKDKVDMIINEMTTSVIDYSTDEEYFTALHEAIGTLLESQING